MKVIISKSAVIDAVESAYSLAKQNSEGSNANYIPFLADIDSNLFGISVVLPDGEIISRGDTDYVFGIESISKVHNTIMVMRQSGSEKLLSCIGADATGLSFNSIFAILLENNHPSTPLVNAGAISAVSMIEPNGDSSSKWEAMVSNMVDLCGSELILLDDLYKSESETNYNNRAISWLLKNFHRIYDDPDMSLDLYTRGCSMGVTVEQLAITGATISMRGFNPISKKQIFNPIFAPQIISLIATVGFYEHTGNWMFSSGLPAKTGVGGGVMGIMPGGFGIAAFSPPLDISGNSIRAQQAIKEIVRILDVNVYDGCSYEFQ